MSAGNHAQAVAYHARRLGIPATIVMPEGTPLVKAENTRSYGARVILHGETLYESAARAREIADAEGPRLRPPLRRPEGHGRPGHHRPRDAGRRARPRPDRRADRRRRADLRHRGRGEGAQARPSRSSASRRPSIPPSATRSAARTGRSAARRSPKASRSRPSGSCRCPSCATSSPTSSPSRSR